MLRGLLLYCAAERNRNVDVCRFINSKDIRDYLRSINYQFTPIEAAWLIYYCRELTLQEKHAAWQELIDTMPDCPIAKRRWTVICTPFTGQHQQRGYIYEIQLQVQT